MFRVSIWLIGGIGLLMAASVFFVTDSYQSQCRDVVLRLVAPAIYLTDRLKGISDRLDENLQTLESVQEEEVRLRTENFSLEQDHQAFLALAKENNELRKKLGFRKAPPFELLSCRVVARDPSYWWGGVYVNVGTSHHPGLASSKSHPLAVVSPTGVVGLTQIASSSLLEVFLVVNENCRITARLEGCKQQGVLVGEGALREGRPRAVLRFIPKSAHIEVGERVLTSGLDGVFPAGLYLGKVSEVPEVSEESSSLYREVVVTPAFDESQSNEIFVILGEP